MNSNYLILTPDGVGSTYLQRALTVYLNCANLDYWNTHELLNGLGLLNDNLYKDWEIGYGQTLDEICKLLKSTSNNLVSRVAQYHITNREKRYKENYESFYNQCNQKFDKIFYCVRDPFEYAISWTVRNINDVFNVYSVKERIDIHGETVKYNLDLNYFRQKLQQYYRYESWAEDNFNITSSVKYEESHHNIDATVKQLTGLDHNVEDRFGISLQDYSKIRYLVSLYSQTRDKKHMPKIDYTTCKSILDLHEFTRRLTFDNKQMASLIPIKMNTMADKKKRVSNFDEAVEIYNKWTLTTNTHIPITQKDIENHIAKESHIYGV